MNIIQHIATGLITTALVAYPGTGSIANAQDSSARAAASAATVVREATRPFLDVSAAEAAGYGPFLGCVSGPQQGAMGVHYVNGDLVGDGLVDAARPEALTYEPRGGRLRLLGVEYIVMAEQWHAANASPPVLLGQVFYYTGSPNRYGLPPFYSLHVWAWRDNPHGTFVDWHPRVSCDEQGVEPAHVH